MRDVNIVVFMGNLTNVPFEFTSESGKKKCKATIACNYENGEFSDVNYCDCIATGSTAELLIKYGTKGKKVQCVGRLISYNKEKDGVNFMKNELEVTDLKFLDGNK